MTDFKKGGAPTPDYDSEDINYVNQKTEFSDDVFVYGKLYAIFPQAPSSGFAVSILKCGPKESYCLFCQF